MATALAGLGAAAIIGTDYPRAQSGPEFYTGKNVDIVGPHGGAPYSPTGSNPFMLGDPDKKQENEPSCDINPTNPLIVFCGMNDYRAVDRPDISGEPWVGASFTMDGGLTWKSHLHPGFKPQLINAPAPLVPPLGYDTAADPVVRVAPGIALFNFIAFDRAGAGGLFVSRWYERNTEGGFPYAWKETIPIAKGTGSPGQSGRFLDKPAMKISLLPGTGVYNFVVPDATQPGGTRIQKVPAAIVHVAYAVFTGNSEQDGTKIVYNRSTDYGATWQSGTELLSETVKINQAPDIAVDPATNRVLVVWRRFATPNLGQTDGIMYALSTNNGQSFGKPAQLAEICPFTQNTTSKTFRTTTHPFVTFDGTAFHAIWAARQGVCGTSGPSRIVMSNLSSAGTWSLPLPIDTAPLGKNQQFQPSIAVSGKRILVTWFDTRRDLRTLNPADPNPDPYVDDYVFTDQGDGKKKVRRRMADVYATEAVAAQTPAFGPPTRVSRYRTGVYPGTPPPPPPVVAVELERNNVNSRLFSNGKVPFHGDYPAAAAVQFVLKDPIASPGEWISSAGVAGAQPIFQVAWTDNRLVRGNTSLNPDDPNSSVGFTPPPISSQSEPDPTTPRGACTASGAGTRDQTVFASRVYPPVILISPSAVKPIKNAAGQPVKRAYAVYLQNTTPDDKKGATALKLRITGASVDSTASFSEDGPVTLLDQVEVARRSSVARTVFVDSPALRPVVRIEAYDAGNMLLATAYINGNAYAAPLEDALDQTDSIPNNPVAQIEIHTPDILYRASAVGTPAIDDPAIDDPAIDDPAIDDPAIDDPAIDDPAIDDPAIDDPAIDDPAIDDPAIDDPAIDDPAIDDAAVPSSNIQDPDAAHPFDDTGKKLTQVTFKIKLDGTVITSMSTKVFINGDQTLLNALNNTQRQLLISRRYTTNDIRQHGANPCASVRVTSYQVIANVIDPVLTNSPTPPSQVNPTIDEPSATIPPGSAIYLTLRVWGDIPGFTPNRVGAVVASQPDNPDGFPAAGETLFPPVIETNVLPEGTQGVQYAQQLANSGGKAPFTWTLDPGPLPGLAGELTLSPSGLLSGTSSIQDAKEFKVKVTDANGLSDTKSFCLLLATAPPAVLDAKTVGSEGGPTLAAMITSLLGPTVEVSNIKLNGSSIVEGEYAGAGTFDGGTAAIGFQSGIVLSSGSVTAAEGTNTSPSSSLNLNRLGDPDLDTLVSVPTFDATVVEFDFKPTAKPDPDGKVTIAFDYVFGSEEYSEYSNSPYNDVFAFYVDTVNRALLPGTNIPVAINTVNVGNPGGDTTSHHPEFFRNNAAGTFATQADGLTTVLTLTARVTPGEWHHFKIAIADANDHVYDSWVFIKGGSLRVVENCHNGVDDDGDGKVDSADPDCVCQGIQPPVIIGHNHGGAASPAGETPASVTAGIFEPRRLLSLRRGAGGAYAPVWID